MPGQAKRGRELVWRIERAGNSFGASMKKISVLFCLLGLGLGFVEGAKRPNVLFIAIDDLNDWVEPLGGHPLVKTPHMNRLAARGTTFVNAHCQSPLCNPSRTSLLLSKRPTSTGIYGLKPYVRTLPEYRKAVSLPQWFARAGYRTYSTGKIWHGGYPQGKEDRKNEFHEWGPPASGRPFPPKKLVTTPFGNHPLVDWGVFDHKDEDKGDYKCASWAVEKLRSMPDNEPFFLACGFFLPHVPCFATQKWFDLYPDDDSVLPPVLFNDRDDTPFFSWYIHWYLPEVRLSWLKQEKQWRNLARSYLACVSFVDHQVGRVLDALEASGKKDNTVVVLWSDHGWHVGEKEISGKNTLWDDGTRVPLIFAGPGVARAAKCAKPAELLDIFPTLIELCGLEKKGDLEGISLMPQLKDAKAPRERPAITSHNKGNHGVRSENWRYIHYADGSEELYDMVKDPNEWTNLAGDARYASVLKEHRKWLPKVDLPPAPDSAARILTYDPETKEAIWEGKKIDHAEFVR